MTEDPQFYREMATARMLKCLQSLEHMFPTEIMANMRALLLKTLEDQFRQGTWSAVEWADLSTFIDKLLHRQSTHPLDFDELYRSREDLERKLLDRENQSSDQP